MTCAIPLGHGLLLQAGLGAGAKAPQLGWWYGYWRLGSLLTVQVQVNGHCRRCAECLTPCLCKGGERCPSGDTCHCLQKCLVLRAKSLCRRAQAYRHVLSPQDRLGKQSGCSERLLRFLECWRSFLFLSCCPLLGCVTVGSTQKIAIRAWRQVSTGPQAAKYPESPANWIRRALLFHAL